MLIRKPASITCGKMGSRPAATNDSNNDMLFSFRIRRATDLNFFLAFLFPMHKSTW